MNAPLRRDRDIPASSRASGRAATQLAVVPGRRRVAWFAVGLTTLVGIVLVAVVLFHTRLAERQLELDRIERELAAEHEQFDILRAQRAELRAPTRLAMEAAALGMSPGSETEFISIDPWVLAVTIARTGELPFDPETGVATAWAAPLDQFRQVKALDSEAP